MCRVTMLELHFMTRRKTHWKSRSCFEQHCVSWTEFREQSQKSRNSYFGQRDVAFSRCRILHSFAIATGKHVSSRLGFPSRNGTPNPTFHFGIQMDIGQWHRSLQKRRCTRPENSSGTKKECVWGCREHSVAMKHAFWVVDLPTRFRFFQIEEFA